MHDSDAILVAQFDDEPAAFASVAPGTRPADRPRPDSSSHPVTAPIALVVVESDAGLESIAPFVSDPLRPTLAVDIGFFDPETDSFLVVYEAGTPLNALGPRTVRVPALPTKSPITSLVLYVRKSGETQPAPYLTLEWPEDIGGRQLTMRFKDPADLRSLVIKWDRSPSPKLPGDVDRLLQTSRPEKGDIVDIQGEQSYGL
jgi:hypothetical protein